MKITTDGGYIRLCVVLVLCVFCAMPAVAEDRESLGTIVKLKHKISQNGDVLVVHVLANDIGSEDPRPVSVWLSDDDILEIGDVFLMEEVISDYSRAPGTTGMPVLAKLKRKRLPSLLGNFAIITIGSAREVFSTGDQSQTIVSAIGDPQCVSDLFIVEDEPNDDAGQAVNLGNFRQDYCAAIEGIILSDGSERELRDVDRYRMRVKEDMIIVISLTHDEEADFDIEVVKQASGEMVAACAALVMPERCVIELVDIDEARDLELMVIPVMGTGPYAMTVQTVEQDVITGF